MTIEIKLFAGHRERVGASSLSLELPPNSTVGDAFDTLVERYPTLAPMERFTSFARNREVVDRDQILHDGDELALLQPVSGGAR